MSALQSGSRLGAYEILAPIGSGGMGEVYRARDSKLKRDVAIKVLPLEFSRDPDRLARAQREAEVLAALNHPHIAQIYGQEEAGESQCLVLEFVDGETLQERLQRGPIPMDEALEFARQIADALEAAHERGIVHRDLKPANIKITSSDQIKVLDFGLAKATDVDSSNVAASNSPTIGGGTLMGVIMGTAAYMSPEQAKGRSADGRSDIWSFGVILYEMLTGKSAFDGETVVEILGGVTKVDPDWTALPATTPQAVRSLIRRCLQKDRKRRLRDIADARFQIEEALSEPSSVAAIAHTPRNHLATLAWVGALIIVAIAASAVTFLLNRSSRTELPEVRAQIITPPGDPTSFAVSPDGRKIVFAANADGKNQLWLRSLDSDVVVPLTPIDARTTPFWSPDSKSVGFTFNQAMNRINIAGGIAQRLTDSGPGTGAGGSWSSDGVILFARSAFSGLYRIPADGGNIEEVTALLPEQASHRYPHFLPDNRHFLFFATGTPKVSGLYLGDLQSKEIQRLVIADTTGVFVPPDIILFARQDILYAQKLNMSSLKPADAAFPVLEHVGRELNSQGSLAVSASASGIVAYRTAGTVDRQLVWFDRSGKQLDSVGAADTTLSNSIRLSPDNTNVTLERTINGNTDVWLMEIARGLLRRFTTDPSSEQSGVWSPDGREIAFQAYRKGRYDLYRKPAAGGGEELLLDSSNNKNLRDWSADGKFLLYLNDTNDDRDIWALPLEGERKPFAVVQSPFYDVDPRFSPDGKWIAYSSDESGRREVYVQAFPKPGKKWQISTSGGTAPQWHRNGRELFYLSPDNRLMSALLTLNTPGEKVDVGKPESLFNMRPQSSYAVAADGKRFLLNMPLADTPTAPITLILNWAGERK